ncbi:MAG: transglutaminase-like domain-containing protein [Zetaproteobacteria bacterium]|nr:transglutaminase-like domain-containing protein [Zetaproteobacteria bacterium]
MIDADHPQIRRLAQDITTGLTTERARAVAVHNWVRDRIAFGWVPHADQERASDTLQRKMGFGVTKSTLFVALLRSLGLAARSRFVSLDGAIFAQFGWHQALVDHAYTEVFLDGHWVATDSYVLPQHQARVALEKLQTLGLQMGYGVSQGGHWSWEGSHAQFIQWTDSVVRQQEFSFFRDFAEFSHYERPSHMGNWWVWLWQPHAAMRLHEQVVKTLGES